MKTAPYDRHAAEYDDWFSKNRFASELGVLLGVEPSEAMRETARERGIDVISGKTEELPFRDGYLASIRPGRSGGTWRRPASGPSPPARRSSGSTAR